jgi:hypothetical protein
MPSLPKAVWLSLGVAFVGVALRILFDTIPGALLLLFAGFLIIILAGLEVIGKTDHDEPFHIPPPSDYRPGGAAGPEFPEDRPQIFPLRHAKAPPESPLVREGLYVANQGGQAFQVQVQPLSILGWLVKFEDKDVRDEEFLGCTSISKEGHGDLSMLIHIWRESPAEMLKALPKPLYILYRSFGDKWYRSICELVRDLNSETGFSVHHKKDDPIEPPTSSGSPTY